MRAGLVWKSVYLSRPIVICLILTGCASINDGTGANFGRISPSVSANIDPREVAIGRKEHPKVIAAYGGVYQHAKVEQAVATLVGRLVAASEQPGRSYRVTILNSPGINAFALPGGYLYVTRGLLGLAADAAELGAVLAHEMAHVTARHALARAEKARNNQLLSRVMNNVIGNKKATALIEARGSIDLAKFSQTQEFEADRIGIRTIAKAGLDPYAAQRFLKSMGHYADYRAGVGDDGRSASFLSSHPSTPARIEKALRSARAIAAPGLGRTEKADYYKAIDGILYGDEPSEGFVRGRTYIHPRLRIAFSLPAGYRLENTTEAVLAIASDGTAVRFDGVEVSRTMPLKLYLQSGWISGLIKGSIRDTVINGLPAAVATARAKGWTFRIAVIRVETATYRFVFATPRPTPGFEGAVAETIGSFRSLSQADAIRFKPLVIKIIQVSKADTQAHLVGRMRGVERPDRLFRIINGLHAGKVPGTGDMVKIVVEQHKK